MKEDYKKETLRRLDVIRSKFKYQFDNLAYASLLDDIEWVKEPIYEWIKDVAPASIRDRLTP